MKILKEECIIGWDVYAAHSGVLFAKITDPLNGPMLGDLYRVPKRYFPNGVGKVTNVENANVTKENSEGIATSKETFWLVDIEIAASDPEDPCDNNFMESIST